MRNDSRTRWFTDTPGHAAPPVEREKRTLFSPDDVDFAVWERNFNKKFGLA